MDKKVKANAKENVKAKETVPVVEKPAAPKVDLTDKVGKLAAMVRQSIADLSFLGKTTHSDYAQRREKELREEFEKLA